MTEAKRSTEALRGEKEVPVWKAKMEENKQMAIERTVKAISETFDTAIEYIEELPEAAQESAFDVFEAGRNAVEQVLEVLTGQLTSSVDRCRG